MVYSILMLGALLYGNLAGAITYGEPDNGAPPNVVSIAGFREARDSNNEPILISSGRCSGSLIRKDEDKLVFLTAGHCSQFWLEGLQNESLADVGVSFDEVIDKDLGPTATSTIQYILGAQPVLYDGYFPDYTDYNEGTVEIVNSAAFNSPQLATLG